MSLCECSSSVSGQAGASCAGAHRSAITYEEIRTRASLDDRRSRPTGGWSKGCDERVSERLSRRAHKRSISFSYHLRAPLQDMGSRMSIPPTMCMLGLTHPGRLRRHKQSKVYRSERLISAKSPFKLFWSSMTVEIGGGTFNTSATCYDRRTVRSVSLAMTSTNNRFLPSPMVI